MKVAIEVVPASQLGEDRAAAFPMPNGHLLVLADGAGGTSGGAAAADAVLESVRAERFRSSADCVRLLYDLDQRLMNVGQTTAVFVVISGAAVFGASVGDSAAWLMANTGTLDLTEHQRPKPMLGSGGARPVGFGPVPFSGRLLIGSDGLFKYVPHERICRLATTSSLDAVPAALIDAARLRSGALQDDVAVIVAA